VHNHPYLFELAKLQQREVEQKAEHERLVSVAVRLRRRARKASAAPGPAVAEREPVERPKAVSVGR
jgi:hypothetical protein